MTDFQPATIEEVMKNVVVYVEIRSDEEDRSDGVKKIISDLGAKVNNKLLKYECQMFCLSIINYTVVHYQSFELYII